MMCVAVHDMPKISRSTIGGGYQNVADGECVISVHDCVDLCVIVWLYDLHVIIFRSEYNNISTWLDHDVCCGEWHVKIQLFGNWGRQIQHGCWIVSNTCACIRECIWDSVGLVLACYYYSEWVQQHINLTWSWCVLRWMKCKKLVGRQLEAAGTTRLLDRK